MQNLRSILVHMDSSSHAARRIEVARQVAECFGADATVQYAVLPAELRVTASLEGGGQAIATMRELDAERRAKALRIFESHAAASPRLSWGDSLRDAHCGLAQRALYADLLILGQRDPDDEAGGDVPADMVQTLLVTTGKPALVLPYASPVGHGQPPGTTVLLAWKETREAARAVAAALPWLARARQVHVVSYGDDARPGLDRIAQYLGRHGITAAVHAAGAERGDIGQNLLSRAADLGVDLLVMGCYGHNRLREFVLGGMSRTVLQSMTVPVLMVH
ncbi:hypothetical protein RD110_08680 [Rhodoferax koreense]|uniref:UspA domain-containing protein n=1 Tax=Rhodoferax koreensis TaxID=1842727 RepID=A0A1P8JU35_9BURK|nr:universal stress protein [Rhodoferax koreense]APW37262.1 hypothetical protein RD110_08680 [Rhodoferax koreense]